MWIGIDDTDSTAGGCTTFVAFDLISRLLEKDYLLVGYPRLVRLNPNVPWKTRGNGSVAFQLTKKKQKTFCVGKHVGTKIRAAKKAKPSDDFTVEQKNEVISMSNEVIESHAELDKANTNPGLVIMTDLPKVSLYERAVRQIIKLDEIIDLLESRKAYYKMYNSGRGLIGATAAIAWRPSVERTFELISYRKRDQWGKNRRIGAHSVQVLEERFPTIFDSYDKDNDHLCIAPHSPCPVLYGIRGTKKEDLVQGHKLILSEENQGWLLFESNQATDDHLQPASIASLVPYQSAIITGFVNSIPRVIQGGHVIFSLIDEQNNVIDCAAYEPTKQFRSIIRRLCRGDHIVVYGGVRESPLTVNIEKIKILQVADHFEKIENPVCPRCGKHMKSKGKDQGYRCRSCNTNSEKAVLRKRNRSLQPGFYEVPVVARRHLSKPLKLMNKRC